MYNNMALSKSFFCIYGTLCSHGRLGSVDRGRYTYDNYRDAWQNNVFERMIL